MPCVKKREHGGGNEGQLLGRTGTCLSGLTQTGEGGYTEYGGPRKQLGSPLLSCCREPSRDTLQLLLSSFLYISPSTLEVLYFRGGASAPSVLFYLIPLYPNRTTQQHGGQRVYTQVRPVPVICKLLDALQLCARESFILIVIVKNRQELLRP